MGGREYRCWPACTLVPATVIMFLGKAAKFCSGSECGPANLCSAGHYDMKVTWSKPDQLGTSAENQNYKS